MLWFLTILIKLQPTLFVILRIQQSPFNNDHSYPVKIALQVICFIVLFF